jgi:hypothetical protein
LRHLGECHDRAIGRGLFPSDTIGFIIVLDRIFQVIERNAKEKKAQSEIFPWSPFGRKDEK